MLRHFQMVKVGRQSQPPLNRCSLYQPTFVRNLTLDTANHGLDRSNCHLQPFTSSGLHHFTTAPLRLHHHGHSALPQTVVTSTTVSSLDPHC